MKCLQLSLSDMSCFAAIPFKLLRDWQRGRGESVCSLSKGAKSVLIYSEPTW